MPLKYRRIAYSYSGPSRQCTALLLQRVWAQNRQLVWTGTGRWSPPTDVYESADSIEVKMELAGVEEEAIEVSLFQDLLLVTGHRDDEDLAGRSVYHEAGIRYGDFEAGISLPVPVEPEQVVARYDRGFLRITLPKAAPIQQPQEGGGPQ